MIIKVRQGDAVAVGGRKLFDNPQQFLQDRINYIELCVSDKFGSTSVHLNKEQAMELAELLYDKINEGLGV